VDSTIIINTPAKYDSVRIKQGGLLIANDSISVTGGLVVETGGIITHGGRLFLGLFLDIGRTLEIQSGGTIDVTGRGLSGGGNLFCRFNGETYDSSGYIICGVMGSDSGGAGASYGGWGSIGIGGIMTNRPYGSIENPRHLGSGGGAMYYKTGGNGGGRVTIYANSIINDGVIQANGTGGMPWDSSGGGSGGSILIKVESISGSGFIQCNGGGGYIVGSRIIGSGGGGRIAIYYKIITIPISNITAYGGIESSSSFHGSAGTIFFKDENAPYSESLGSLLIEDSVVNGLGTPINLDQDSLISLTCGVRSIATTEGNISVLERCDIDNRLDLRATDTLFILMPDSLGLTGAGYIVGGTIQRVIEDGSIQVYRFESDSTYIQFNGTGKNPSEVAMTVYPDISTRDSGEVWEVIPSVVDTLANVIVADTVKEFSKWRMGIPKVTGLEDTIQFVRRIYDIYVEGGSDFSARLSLRYDQSEVPLNVREDSLKLLRLKSIVNVEEQGTEIPKSFLLSQNFPNPFNPSTTINYQIPVVSAVILKIYNVLGQNLVTLVNEIQEPGFKSIDWINPNVAGGIYFYRLEAIDVSNPRKSYTQVRKMIFVK
jgi:hypothetical protein